MDLQEFNSAPDDRLRPLLAACCDVPRWVDGILAGRPYGDTRGADPRPRTRRRESSTTVRSTRRWQPTRASATGRTAHSTEAAWSRNEQAGVGDDPEIRAALAAGNREYEERFGRVFLICATGLSAQEMLTSLRQRLTHDESAEAAVVQDELRKIALLRLAKVVAVGKEVPA